jgi:hypothetical protein
MVSGQTNNKYFIENWGIWLRKRIPSVQKHDISIKKEDFKYI